MMKYPDQRESQVDQMGEREREALIYIVSALYILNVSKRERELDI